MNVNLKLKLPIINNSTQEERSLVIESSLLLNPLYALEEDILGPFDEVKEEDLPWIRKVLFNSSLTVYRLTKKLEELKLIKSDDLILLRRDFTICLASNEIAKQMNKNNKKPLPHSVTKAVLVEMYCNQFSDAKIRKQINEILNEKNISKDTKIIPHLEFMEFVETYGLPKGYYIDDEDNISNNDSINKKSIR